MVGRAKAVEILLTGRTINASEALNIGLVNLVVKNSDLMSKSLEMARMIADKSQLAIEAALRCIDFASDNHSIDEGLAYESKSFSEIFNTKDAIEGLTAFAEKRKPNFKDC